MLRVPAPAYRQRRRVLLPATVLALLLIVYSNLVAFAPDDLRQSPWKLTVANLSLMVVLLLWAIRGQGLSLAEIGLGRQRAMSSALLGLITGSLMAAIVTLGLLIAPLVLGRAIAYGEVEGMSPGDLLWRVLVKVPLGTALFEEVAFRGVLQALLLAALRPSLALLAGGIAYGLWHVVINLQTIQDTALAESLPLLVLGQIVQMVGVTVGGIIFGLMRLYTGHVAASTIVHWLTVASMITVLYLVER